MKAVLPGPSGVELREIDRPSVDDDDVLIRICAASLNAADWHAMKMLSRVIGKVMGAKRRSRVVGIDMAGVVEAVGAKVATFKVGDEVFGAAHGSCAEYAVTTENRITKKAPSLSFEAAAALPIAGCTAIQGLRDKGRVRPGDRVIVYGAGGGVGTFAIQIAKAMGAHVTAVTSPSKIGALRALGADVVLDYTREDFTQSTARYDVVVDLGGDKSNAEMARVLTADGRIVLAGAPKSTVAMIARVLTVMRKTNDARRMAYMAKLTVADLVSLQTLVEEKKMTALISARVQLAETAEAIRQIASGQTLGKIIVDVSAPMTARLRGAPA